MTRTADGVIQQSNLTMQLLKYNMTSKTALVLRLVKRLIKYAILI